MCDTDDVTLTDPRRRWKAFNGADGKEPVAWDIQLDSVMGVPQELGSAAMSNKLMMMKYEKQYRAAMVHAKDLERRSAQHDKDANAACVRFRRAHAEWSDADDERTAMKLLSDHMERFTTQPPIIAWRPRTSSVHLVPRTSAVAETRKRSRSRSVVRTGVRSDNGSEAASDAVGADTDTEHCT
jgi:hypothetical protein